MRTAGGSMQLYMQVEQTCEGAQRMEDRPQRRLQWAPGGTMSCYSRLISRWPHVVLPIVLLVVIACAMVAIVVYPYPDLSDPIKGFEARGTPIKGRELAWLNLRNLSGSVLTEAPQKTFPPEVLSHPAVLGLYRGFTFVLSSSMGSRLKGLPNWRQIPAEDARNIRIRTSRPTKKALNSSHCNGGYIDGEPKIVFGSQSGASLLTPSNIHSMCLLEKRLRPRSGCAARQSIPYLLELLQSKQCHLLDQADIDHFLQRLRQCASYYHSGQLKENCLNPKKCISVPAQCKEHMAVFITLHYLSDDLFFAKQPTGEVNFNEVLTFALFSPSMFGLEVTSYYHSYIEESVLVEGDVDVRAVDMLSKFRLFDDYLLVDMMFFGVAMLLILIAMCIYLRSFIVTIATVLDVVFTLILAYTIYRFVGIQHFPFMNILTGLICIAIGADDVFIFFDTWQQVKLENPEGTIEAWMATTFHHAALSIFVTSLTTASAFLSNLVSEITDIRCFGLFSGIAILCNFVFMVTWVPSIIVLIEKFKNECCKDSNTRCSCYDSCIKCASKFNIIFVRGLPFIVQNTWYFWLIFLSILGCGGLFVVFVLPRLELPTSKEFQVFQPNDPMEVWDTQLKHKFRFYKESESSLMSSGLPIIAAWGLQQIDNGDHLNPDDHGTIVTDHTFDMSSPESQVWMESFCKSLTNSSILAKSMFHVPCTISLFNNMMALPCVHPALSPCCNQSKPPFKDAVFTDCLPKLTHVLTTTAKLTQLPSHGQPIYNKESGAFAGYIITAISSQLWSPILEDMEAFRGTMEEFMISKSKSAPVGVQGGWMTSYFKFYDLQRALSSGTYVAIGVSVAVAFAIMFLTSLNLLITIFALITILLTIAVTVGILVLLGWKLNILESVTISLAVGLSIDFTIHYGVAYRLSTSEDRMMKVRESFSRVGSPVAMAAFTTFIAGVTMMPAKVLAYTQLGVFLMIVMATSWIYSTLFFQSLCLVLGPKKTVELSCCCQCCQPKRSHGHEKVDEEVVNAKVNADPWDPDMHPQDLNEHAVPDGPGTMLVDGEDPPTLHRNQNQTSTTSLSNGGHFFANHEQGEVLVANGQRQVVVTSEQGKNMITTDHGQDMVARRNEEGLAANQSIPKNVISHSSNAGFFDSGNYF